MTSGPSVALATPTHQRLDRALQASIEGGLQSDGCVLIVGPPEVGKSDLAGHVAIRFGDAARYFSGNVDEDLTRLRVELQQDNNDKLFVVDEIQRLPDAIDLVRFEIDKARTTGQPRAQFLLVGATGEALRLVSDRLGTRARICRLTPIVLTELTDKLLLGAGHARTLESSEVQETTPVGRSDATTVLETLWMRGGFPPSLLASNDEASFSWRQRYIEAVCRRSIGDIGNAPSASKVFETFARIAATQGEPYNHDAGQRARIDALVEMGLVRQLRPWSRNRLKRFRKNPKTYVRDSGLLHSLLNQRTLQQLRSDATTYGHSWEGFCIENLIAQAPNADPFFYRSDNEQNEVDLVLEYSGDRRLAIEMKAPSAGLGRGFGDALAAIEPVGTYVVRPVPESSYDGKYPVKTLGDMISIVHAMRP